jgi:hypothetical protein
LVWCELPISSPLPKLEINELYNPFTDARSGSPTYEIAKKNGSIVKVYWRPFYIGTEQVIGIWDVMFFTGRRWVVTHINQIYNLMNMPDIHEGTIEFFTKSFHAHGSRFNVTFVSEPIDIDTPADGPTPVGLRWSRSQERANNDGHVLPIQAPDLNSQEEAVLLCAICNDTYRVPNRCLFGGRCMSNGECDCTANGSAGKLCQIATVGNGRYNLYFKCAGYGFGGGTCFSSTFFSNQYPCGYRKDGDIFCISILASPIARTQVNAAMAIFMLELVNRLLA